MTDLLTPTAHPQPGWTPLPTPVPQVKRPRSRIAVILAILLGLVVAGLAAVSVLAITQHSAAVDARAHGAEVQEDLDHANAYLADTEADLETSQGAVTAKDTQLASCKVVVEATGHMLKAISPLIAASGGNVYVAIDKLDEATGYMTDATDTLDAAGYDSIEAAYAVCAPAGTGT